MPSPGTGSSLRGIPTTRNGRHAFVHERVMEMIARETELRGSVTFCKAELAKRLSCCVRTLDRAVTMLRRGGYLETTPIFSESGAQLGNEYRATAKGLELVEGFRREKKKGAKKPAADA